MALMVMNPTIHQIARYPPFGCRLGTAEQRLATHRYPKVRGYLLAEKPDICTYCPDLDPKASFFF